MSGGSARLLAAACLAAAPMQDAAPRYTAAQLHCTRWSESSSSDIETATTQRSSDATAGRRALWRFRARDTTGGVALEGWYDSLAVWRRVGGAELAPDTDGVIGGRYRGLLGPTGSYINRASPFVPDEVAEVAELGTALDDLFPPLPPARLAPGQVWRDEEVRIERLADTVIGGRSLWRFSLRARRERGETVPHGDTVPIPIRQTTTESGELAWDPAVGLVRRTREIVVETSIPAGARVRLPVRSRVRQQVELERLPGDGCS